jgi:hypothetical protein
MDKEKEGLSTSAQEAITNAAKANVDAAIRWYRAPQLPSWTLL